MSVRTAPASSPAMQARVPILVLGPDPAMTGGMSAVVGQMLRLDWPWGYAITTLLDTVRRHRREGWLARLARHVAQGRVIETVIRDNGIRLVHIHTCSGLSFWRSAVDAWIAQRQRCRVVLHMHGARFDEFYAGCGAWRKALIRRVLRRADAVIALCQSWAAWFVNIEPAATVRVVENAVERPSVADPCDSDGCGTGFQPVTCATDKCATGLFGTDGGGPDACGTGFQPVTCGTGFQPVTCSTGFQPVPEAIDDQSSKDQVNANHPPQLEIQRHAARVGNPCHTPEGQTAPVGNPCHPSEGHIAPVKNRSHTPGCDMPPGDMLQPAPCRFLMLARMDDWKGVDDLLDACGLLTVRGVPFEVTLAGPPGTAGDARLLARKIADRRLAANVVYVGEVRGDAKQSLLARADVLVQPSRHEGMPITVLEAFAAGRPVVATSVGAVPEVVEHGVHGLLAPPQAPDALASAMACLALDTDLRHRCGAQARRLAETRFSLDRFRNDLVRLYNEILA